MAREMIILMKRGLKQDLPELRIGEIGFCVDTKEVYMGSEVGNVLINNYNYKKVQLEPGQDYGEWLDENVPDENTRYIFYNSDGEIEIETLGIQELGGRGGVLEFQSENDFPAIGKEAMLYLAKYRYTDEGLQTDEPYNALFVWDSNLSTYTIVSGGGAGDGSAATITFVPNPPEAPRIFSKAMGEDIIVSVTYDHSELQPGTLRILRSGVEVASRGLPIGDTDINLTSYIRPGANSITLRVSDGERTRSIVYNITGVAVALTSAFDDSKATTNGSINIPYRLETESRQRKVFIKINDAPYGEINITQPNNTLELNSLSHGVHKVEIQGSVMVGGE